MKLPFPSDKYSTKGKIVRNVFWAVFGKFVNMFGMLFVGILVARYLGPEKYGLMNYVISYVSIFTVVAGFGLSSIEIRELANHPQDKNRILGTCFFIRLFFALLAYLLLAIFVLSSNMDHYCSALILTYAFVLFTGCFEVIRNFFLSIIKNEYVVKSEIARTLIGAFLKILLLVIHSPLEWFIIATAFDTILVSSGYIISYNKEVGRIQEWSFDKSLLPYLIKQAFPLVLSGAAIVIYERIDQVMIGDMLSKTEVGYFATAGRFLGLILFLPGIMTQTVVPLLVQSRERNIKEYTNKSKQVVSIVTWISVFLSAIVSLLAYWIIYYTYGTLYMAAVPVLQILAWKTVGMGLSGSAGQLIIIEKIQKWAVIRNLIGCVACVILNYLIIPIYGIIGSAFITIVTVFISGCFSNIFIPPYHHILKVELYAIFKGWKHLPELKLFLER